MFNNRPLLPLILDRDDQLRPRVRLFAPNPDASLLANLCHQLLNFGHLRNEQFLGGITDQAPGPNQGGPRLQAVNKIRNIVFGLNDGQKQEIADTLFGRERSVQRLSDGFDIHLERMEEHEPRLVR